MQKLILSWSGGKDCALALYKLQRQPEYKVAGLLTTITKDYDRISMHGVRRTLLEEQAASLGIPLIKIFLPTKCTNEIYEQAMSITMLELKEKGIDTIAFGDIYLEDLRAYREKNLAKAEMKAVFPLWKRDSKEIIATFLSLGFKAITSTVDSKKLGAGFCCREIDESFIAALPKDVDPCGENGEFHTFCYAGPIFKSPVKFTIGEKVLRDGFWYCDLIH